MTPALRAIPGSIEERLGIGAQSPAMRVLRRRTGTRRVIAAQRSHCFAGATIFITNEVGASPGPNGPGTLLRTGGRFLR